MVWFRGTVENIKLHQEKIRNICSSPSTLKKERRTQICNEQEAQTPVWLENVETDRLRDPSKDGRSLKWIFKK
jgi:hypothetical protein